MAFQLKLYDGTTEIDFLREDYRLADGGLQIPPPKKKQVWSGNSIYSNGGQLVTSTWENRTITLQFQVTGATRNELVDRISAIEKMIETARTRSIEQQGARIEFMYMWDGAAGPTYFEVLDGELTWPENVMSVEQVHQKTQDKRFVIFDFELELTCAPFSYSYSPVNASLLAVGLTNGNGSNVTNGLVVWNHDDTGTGHDDWVEIPGDYIDGDIASSVVIELTGNTNMAEGVEKIYVGVRKGNQSFKHVLEDDAAEFRIGSATPVSDTLCSGGTYSALAFTGNTEQVLIRWALTDTETQNTVGPFRLIGRCRPYGQHWSTDANYRIRVLYATGVILYEGEWRKPLNNLTEMLDFGTVFLPPWLPGRTTNLAGIKIEIQVKGDSTGTSATIQLDNLTLMPQDGGYRVLQFRAGGLYYLESVIDDGWTDTVYHKNTSGKETGLPFAMMPRIKLKPGITQRLYFLQEGTNQNTEIERQLKVIVRLIPEFNVLV